MKELHLDYESLDQLFKTIDDNFKELRDSISKIETRVLGIENDMSMGTIISDIQVTIDDEPSDTPSCETAIVKVGKRSILSLNFKGLKGSKGESGTNGRRGTIMYVGADTTTLEASNRLIEMVGSNEFRVGDIFLNSKSFEIKECIEGGVPANAKWKLLGVLNGTSVDLGDATGIFVGTKNQLVLGNGTVIGIDEFIEKYLPDIKKGLNFFRGGANQVTTGNGNYVTIPDMFRDNIEIIRKDIGIVTRDHEGLVPRLPSN